MIIKMLHLIWLIPLGVLLGFVINHLADVLPNERKIFLKPYCTKCKQTFDLGNYITFRACPNCDNPPGIRRLIVVIFMILGISISYYVPPQYPNAFFTIIVIPYLILVFVIDLEHRLILHPVTIAGIILFAIIGVFTNGIFQTFLGGVSGFGIMFILYLSGILFSRWMSKRRGEEIEEVALGFGDVNLSLVLGLLLGWPKIAVNLLFAILTGGIFSGFFILYFILRKKYNAFTPIPYAPFLIISTIALIFLSAK